MTKLQIRFTGVWMLLFAALLVTGCSKSDVEGEKDDLQGYIKVTVDGEQLHMPYLAKMEEKENQTWNLNALTTGSGNSLKGKKGFTINIRDAKGALSVKTYKLDDGSCRMSASFTEFLDDVPNTYHWTASTGSALSGDSFTLTIISIENGIAKGKFSGKLRVTSSGNLETFREVKSGEFLFPYKKK
ncbi:hypothetical protein [Niabella beijingensis]|uniref:hypothetical protein n=1 Tax=Niabella beijingensis TaxID=2872700 RepID=UPI001CBED39A|nr:hypothetical protein [Niabella beijingensis]MBZ4189392.1 hypothetical protein [Niabella beijingensis]